MTPGRGLPSSDSSPGTKIMSSCGNPSTDQDALMPSRPASNILPILTERSFQGVSGSTKGEIA